MENIIETLDIMKTYEVDPEYKLSAEWWDTVVTYRFFVEDSDTKIIIAGNLGWVKYCGLVMNFSIHCPGKVLFMNDFGMEEQLTLMKLAVYCKISGIRTAWVKQAIINLGL